MVSGYGWSLILVTLHAIKVSKTLVQAFLPMFFQELPTHFFYASRGGFGGRGHGQHKSWWFAAHLVHSDAAQTFMQT